MDDTSGADSDLEARILGDPMAVLALTVAIGQGLLQRLVLGPVPDPEAFRRARGEALLLAWLSQAGVARRTPQGWGLSDDFQKLWASRAAPLTSRLQFQRMALTDLMMDAEGLLFDLPGFMAQARTFRFFDYSRAQDTKAAALEDTSAWVSYVTALTKAEAPVLVPLLPLEGCSRLLEIGGNSGAFAEAMLAQYPDLQATVFDLPAVCHIGVAQTGDAGGRLAFHPGDARKDDWPKVAGGQAEIVLFKSVLHDWEDPAVQDFCHRAARYLPPGGQVLIVEREPLESDAGADRAAWGANLVFAPFYRRAQDYAPFLRQAGFEAPQVSHADLDMRFMILSARLPE